MQIPYGKSHTDGFMSLVLERAEHLDHVSGNSGIAFSLAHYFRKNGDLCKDPEIVVIVYPTLKMAETLTFEKSLPPLYQVVFLSQENFTLISEKS